MKLGLTSLPINKEALLECSDQQPAAGIPLAVLGGCKGQTNPLESQLSFAALVGNILGSDAADQRGKTHSDSDHTSKTDEMGSRKRRAGADERGSVGVSFAAGSRIPRHITERLTPTIQPTLPVQTTSVQDRRQDSSARVVRQGFHPISVQLFHERKAPIVGASLREIVGEDPSGGPTPLSPAVMTMSTAAQRSRHRPASGQGLSKQNPEPTVQIGTAPQADVEPLSAEEGLASTKTSEPAPLPLDLQSSSVPAPVHPAPARELEKLPRAAERVRTTATQPTGRGMRPAAIGQPITQLPSKAGPNRTDVRTSEPETSPTEAHASETKSETESMPAIPVDKMSCDSGRVQVANSLETVSKPAINEPLAAAAEPSDFVGAGSKPAEVADAPERHVVQPTMHDGPVESTSSADVRAMQAPVPAVVKSETPISRGETSRGENGADANHGAKISVSRERAQQQIPYTLAAAARENADELAFYARVTTRPRVVPSQAPATLPKPAMQDRIDLKFVRPALTDAKPVTPTPPAPEPPDRAANAVKAASQPEGVTGPAKIISRGDERSLDKGALDSKLRQADPPHFEPQGVNPAKAVNAVGGPALRHDSDSRTVRVPQMPSSTVNVSEPQMPLNRRTPTREITVQIAGLDRRLVEVRLQEQNGRVQVEVRAPDKDTAVALRSDLADLARAVEQRGYHIDTWTPPDTYPGTPQERMQAPQHAHQGSAGDQKDHSHSEGDAYQDQRRKHAEDPEWLLELQRRLSGEEV